MFQKLRYSDTWNQFWSYSKRGKPEQSNEKNARTLKEEVKEKVKIILSIVNSWLAKKNLGKKRELKWG